MTLPSAATLTLAQWLSPAFPVGAFSYSHGLETSVTSGLVHDPDSLSKWLTGILMDGSGWSDAVILSSSYRATDPETLTELDTLARALAPSCERLLETDLQGAAFDRTLAALYGTVPRKLVYPVAVGAAARAHDLPLCDTLAMYLHAFAANLVSAAVRLVPLGQTDGQRVLTDLTPLCADLAKAAEHATPDDLGGFAWMADISAMSHETQPVRLFRS